MALHRLSAWPGRRLPGPPVRRARPGRDRAARPLQAIAGASACPLRTPSARPLGSSGPVPHRPGRRTQGRRRARSVPGLRPRRRTEASRSGSPWVKRPSASGR